MSKAEQLHNGLGEEPIQEEVCLLVLYHDVVVDHQHHSDNDRDDARDCLDVVDVALGDTLLLLELEGVLHAGLYLRVEFEETHYLLSVGLPLHVSHDLISELLGQRVEDLVLGEVDDLVLLILSCDLDFENSLLEVLYHF